MTRPSKDVTLSSGDVVPTHSPTTGGAADAREYQVVMIAGADGHIRGTRNTYSVAYRLADATTTGQALSLAFTTNQVRQAAVLYHTAASTKTITLKRCELHIAATAATILGVQLQRVTSAPATANGVANIVAHSSASPATEALAHANPTTLATAAADTAAFFVQEFNLPANTVIPAPGTNQPIVLYPPQGQPSDDAYMAPICRAGVLEGFAVRLQSTAAVTIKCTVRMIYIEE